MDFYRYDERGQIIETGGMPEKEIHERMEKGERIGSGYVTRETHYVDGKGRLCGKDDNPASISTLELHLTESQSVTLSDVPDGSTIYLDGREVGAPLSFKESGTHSLRIESPQQLAVEFQLIVKDHEDLRRELYPVAGDQFDALWKILDALTGELPTEAAARVLAADNEGILDQVRQVKEAIPKPIEQAEQKEK